MESPKVKADDSLARTLNHRNFDPVKFAKSISKESDGDKDLHETQHRVQMLGDRTAHILKKQVYKNYQLFIDTAKEISYLEGEMFQLNTILTEQKHLMDDMIKTFASKDQFSEEVQEKKSHNTTVDKEAERRKIMKSLLTKVEGCESVVEDSKRYLVHDGDVVELDMDSFKSLGKIHLFLFNDCLMLAKCVPTRRGKAVGERYKFHTNWDVDTLAMVNARDVGPVKNAFKVLVFANARMFQCETAKEKREWIEVMDATKRRHLSKDEFQTTSPKPTTPTSPTITKIPVVTNKKSKLEELTQATNDESTRHSVIVFANRCEDLDVYIAQRNFEQAVDMILELKELVASIPNVAPQKDCEEKLDERICQLVDVLCGELKTTPDRSLRRGSKVLRRPVSLLIRLGKVSKACTLFLKNRSGAIEFALQQLRTEGSITLYINKLSKLFFNFLNETAAEFEYSFNEINGCFSAFIVWVEKEMELFVHKLSTQVISVNTEVADVAECVSNAQLHCSQLKSQGLDVDFMLNRLLMRHIQSSIKDHRQKIIDATKLRNSEECWKMVNMGTPQAADRLVEEMQHLGLSNFEDFRHEMCFIQLTTSTLAFTRALLSHTDICIKMIMPELEKNVLTGIFEIASCFTSFIDGCLKSERSNKEKFNLIKQNGKFLAISLIPLVEQKLKKSLSYPPKKLEELRTSFLKEISR